MFRFHLQVLQRLLGRAAQETTIARGRLRRDRTLPPHHGAKALVRDACERLGAVRSWLLDTDGPANDDVEVDVLELREAKHQLVNALEDVDTAQTVLTRHPVPQAMLVDAGRVLGRAVDQLEIIEHLAWGPTTSSNGAAGTSGAPNASLVEPARNHLVIHQRAGAAHRAPVNLGRDARSRPMAKTKATKTTTRSRPMAKTKATKTTTRAKARATKAKTTKTKASTAPKRDGLQPTSALGRALLSMIHLFLDDESAGGNERRRHLLVHAFIERSKYGLQYTTLGELEGHIASLLLSGCESNDGARDEANKLAGRLVDEVFELGYTPLAELVPATLAAVEREVSGKQEKAAAQREAKNRAGGNSKPKAPARAGKGSASKGSKAPKTPKGGATAAGGKRAKAKPASSASDAADVAARAAVIDVVVPPRLYDQAVAWIRKVREPKSVHEIASHLGCDVTVATRIMDQMIDDDVWPSRSASAPTATGANDPTYARGLAVLRKLGNQVDDAYAVDELEETLGISLERAEALLAAIKASGDWPRPSSSGKADAKTPAEEPEKESGSSQHDATFAAAERYVADQERQGKRVTAAALKKALGVGHARAGKLLEQVRAAKTSPSAAAA